MNAPLLLGLRDGLVGRAWSVLRFNFRGIAGSQGEPSTGEAEVADALGAIDLVARRHPGVPIAIAGWSFGGAVAIRAAAEAAEVDSPAACVAIAPAINEKPGVTAGLPDPKQVHLSCPVLVVHGVNDDVIPADDCRNWAKGLSGARYVELPGANHFFWAKYDDLAKVIVTFLDEVV